MQQNLMVCIFMNQQSNTHITDFSSCVMQASVCATAATTKQQYHMQERCRNG